VNRWNAASLLVVTAFYGWVARRFALAGPLAAILAVPLLFPRARVTLGKNPARGALALAGATGIAIDWFAPAIEHGDVLRKPWTALVLGALGVGAAQLVVVGVGESPEGEDRSAPFAFLPGLVALMAAGETGAGPVYVAAVVAWLALTLMAQRAGDVGRPAWRDIPRRERLFALALVGVAVAVAAGSAIGLPPLSRWTERTILRSLGSPETGFSERMWLGSLDGLLDSDEVVMRLEGPRTDYLRGAVFDHYEHGRWGRLRPARLRPVDASAPHDEGDRVRATVVAGARDRYFLPQRARAVSVRGPLSVDRFGVPRVDAGTATEISFALGNPPDFPAEAPTEDDLDIPVVLRRPLARLAAEWTEGAATPEAKVAAITAHLMKGFTYSRTFQRRRADPLLDFLFDDRRGHCEYFASATALLARSVGIPARVVIGYRVAEQNQLGSYWVVREKNAHAWAEVYLPSKGFITVDATPADPLAQNAPHTSSWTGALADLLAASWARAIARLTLRDLIVGGVVVIAVGLVLRRLRRPRRARERAERARVERPPPSLIELFEALRKKGLARGESEPLERFSARLEEAGLADAAALLGRWAALRYGGIGDADSLSRETRGLTERLRRK
jgi:hypothetical protein